MRCREKFQKPVYRRFQKTAYKPF